MPDPKILCPTCSQEATEKHYAPGQAIHGHFQLIGVAQVPLTVTYCNFCNSYKTTVKQRVIHTLTGSFPPPEDFVYDQK